MSIVMRILPRMLLTVALSVLAANASMARDRTDCERDYQPRFGQRGKDVPWEPTSNAMATAMLRLANTTAADRVYDLGAGDGAIVIAAAKQFGAAAVGIEYNSNLAALAQCYIGVEGLSPRAQVIVGDIFAVDFSRATVVTLFLYPKINLRLRPSLLKMQPGTRVVSHVHDMKEWKWDDEVKLDGRRAYLWIVPAQIQRQWIFSDVDGKHAFTLDLRQRFQMLSGHSLHDGTRSKVSGSIRGNDINLRLGDSRQFTGTLVGRRINATITDGKTAKHYIGIASEN